MNEGWVKVWRSLKENPVIFDDKASRILLWLFVSVNRKTGSIDIGRYTLAREVRMKDTTLYKVLKRLEKKYEIVTISSNKLFTTIRFINWAKFQSATEPVTGSSDNRVTTGEQHSNTITRIKNKEVRNSNILSDEPKVTKVYERLAVEKQQPIHRVSYHLEDTLKNTTVNWGKAGKALAMMLKANYTEKQIMWTITEMAKEEFYVDKGFDLMTVANNIDKYKAKARKVIYGVQPTN